MSFAAKIELALVLGFDKTFQSFEKLIGSLLWSLVKLSKVLKN